VNTLLVLPVALPIGAAGVSLAVGPRLRARRLVSLVTVLVSLAVSVAVLASVDDAGALAVAVGDRAAPLGIVLVADRTSALLLVISQTVIACVLVYATGQGESDGDGRGATAVFHPAYLVLSAGVSLAFLAGDLFNLYVAIEILLTSSYVLLTLGGTAERVRAGMTYVVVSLASSVVLLTTIGLVYGAVGTVTMADLGPRLAALPDGIRTALQLMLLVAFGVKAAVFPLAAWLPDSYPTAPAPVTAIFAGLLTKVGVYAVLRTETLLFGGSQLRGLLLVVSALTMVSGVLGALAQDDLRRLLSFTLVSHVGFMTFGIAVGGVDGLAGTLLYMLNHITVQTALFLVSGLLEQRTGTNSLDRLGGLGRVAPLVGVLYLVPALSLAGIPPLPGFLAKLGLLQAGIAAGGAGVAVAGVAVLTSLLTLWVMARVWSRAFWGDAGSWTIGARVAPAGTGEPGPRRTRVSRPRAVGADVAPPPPGPRPHVMIGATAALVAVLLAITVAAGPLAGLCDRAASDLAGNDAYRSAVAAAGRPS